MNENERAAMKQATEEAFCEMKVEKIGERIWQAARAYVPIKEEAPICNCGLRDCYNCAMQNAREYNATSSLCDDFARYIANRTGVDANTPIVLNLEEAKRVLAELHAIEAVRSFSKYPSPKDTEGEGFPQEYFDGYASAVEAVQALLENVK